MKKIKGLPNFESLLPLMKDIFESRLIHTYSGHLVDVFNPDPKEIVIEDIAHALSNLCRYGGHSNKFYSVAQHSIAISHLVDPKFALDGLLHDATEAYLIDLPRPIKHQLEVYKITEDNFFKKAISKKFNIASEIPDEVHFMDNAIVCYEWFHFMDKNNNMQEKVKKFVLNYLMPKTNHEIEEEFLKRYKLLTNNRQLKKIYSNSLDL